MQPDAAPAAVQQLVQQYAAAAAAEAWAIANPLAAGLAAVAVRTQSWPVEQLVPQLLALLHAALQDPPGSSSGASGGSISSSQLAPALHLLSAVAEAACSLDTSMHPQRREAAKAALAAAPEPLAAVQRALAAAGPGAVQLQAAALQMVQAWCALGPPPAGVEAASELVQQMHLAALNPALGSAAAEAVAALYGSCCPEPGGSSCSSSSNSSGSSSTEEREQRRRALLGALCGMLPSFAAALQQALSQAHSSSQQAQLLNAALSVLGAAAKAADSQAQLGTAAQQDAVQLAADVALLAMQHPQFDVVLAALQHWDEQLERWKALDTTSSSSAACSPQQRQALLGQLCSALLQRMTLPPHLPPACLTADARDLPDPVQQVGAQLCSPLRLAAAVADCRSAVSNRHASSRTCICPTVNVPALLLQVRREVADTFRAATDCLGMPAARQQLLQLAQQAHRAWQAGGGWQEFECALYALNLVWSKQRSVSPGAACAAEALQVAALVAAALQPGVPKLAGTALTLLGGMAEQLPLLEGAQTHRQQQPHEQQQQPPLLRLLSLLVQLLQQTGDEKLSRNAATCCSRLAAHGPLAALLVTRHPGWSDALCSCFAVAAGGQQQQLQPGQDQPASQFLLSAICHLAAAGAEASIAAEASPAAAGQCGSQLLQQLLSQPAAAAEAALAAAATASTAEHRQQLLSQAALHIETIAVALEAAAGGSTGISGSKEGPTTNCLAEQLPSLLSSLAGVLQHAATVAATAAAAQLPGEPQLLQALCRVAAAAAATPAASAGLQLLQPFAAAPQDPCVLRSLTSMAGSIYLQASVCQVHQAVSSCIQASAAQHADDPDWQPALLHLGEACLRHLPAVAADAAPLDALLTVAHHSMRSYNRTVCEQAVSFAEAVCCGGSSGQSIAGGAAEHVAAGTAARQQLQQRLDAGGLGTALVLGLLLAAAGAMPPYMVIAIADALHRVWRTVGTDRCDGLLAACKFSTDCLGRSWLAWHHCGCFMNQLKAVTAAHLSALLGSLLPCSAGCCG